MSTPRCRPAGGSELLLGPCQFTQAMAHLSSPFGPDRVAAGRPVGPAAQSAGEPVDDGRRSRCEAAMIVRTCEPNRGRTVSTRTTRARPARDQHSRTSQDLHEGMPMTFADRGTVTTRALPYAAGLAALLVAAGCTSGAPTPNVSTTAPTTASSSSTTTTAASPTTTAKATPTVDPVIAKIPPAARPETIDGSCCLRPVLLRAAQRGVRDATPDASLLRACSVALARRAPPLSESSQTSQARASP